MMSKKTLEAYRRMTPGERLALTLEAIREATPLLLVGPPDVVDRRFQRIRDEKNARNAAIINKLMAAERRDAGS